MDTAALLLRIAFHRRIDEANADEARDTIARLAGHAIPDFHAALEKCLVLGWIEDPIRLEDHALQCHWRLILTQAGVAQARKIIGA